MLANEVLPGNTQIQFKNLFKFLFKILISLICLWYISTKISFSSISAAISKVDVGYFLLAIATFITSKLFSSIRLNINFLQIQIHLSQWVNIKLHWLGMFFNLCLPGSISGDAYKVMRLQKITSQPISKITAAVLLDRFSGLAALGLMTCILWLFLFKDHALNVFIYVGLIAILPIFYYSVKIIFPYLIDSFWPTFLWGIAVQVFQVLTVLLLLKSIGIDQLLSNYTLIFLVSSVIAVLPFTIGGLGARELVFLWGANLFQLDHQSAISVSLLFYITTVISSLLGIIFLFCNPLKEFEQKMINTK